MTLEPPPPPAADPQPPRGAWLGGAAGVVALVGLALWRPELAGPALAAAVVVALITAITARRRPSPPSAAPGVEAEDPAPDTETHQDALEALSDPVVVVEGAAPDDLAGRRILFANRAARAVLRIQGETPLLTAAVRDPEVLEAVDAALFAGEERLVEHEPGGPRDRYWRVRTRPPSAADGRARALLALRDETDSRRIEQMRVDFLANASHELRTPLASLTGFIETLKGHARDDPEARDRFLDIMGAQADRMARLVADLLSLSRIELNEHIPPSGRVDLALAVAEVAEAVAPITAAKGIRVSVERPDPGAAMVIGDRDEIVQVIQNLVDNAVKYAGSGGAVDIVVQAGQDAAAATGPRMADAGRVALLAPDRAPDARFGVVTVRDHGPGLAREHLPRLTERFYRVEGQKSGDRAGTGLGLAIVKHILNRHRGGLTVESAPGQGAAFTAWLPAAPPDAVT